MRQARTSLEVLYHRRSCGLALTSSRDFIDYFGAVAVSGGPQFTVQFGLDVGSTDNQPFLLLQRPNVSSRGDVVPEPATVILLGSGLLGGALRMRRRTGM